MTANPVTNGVGAAPLLPPAGTEAPPATLRELRRWQLGSGTALPAPTTTLPADTLPALLTPFRDPTRVRHDYPLLIETDGDAGEPQVRPLGELLAGLAAQATNQARVLQDNLQRFERRLRVLLAHDAALDAATALRTAGGQMLAEMQLRDTIAAGLKSDLEAMASALPAGELLALQPGTPLRFLLAVARHRVTTARRAFAQRIQTEIDGLRALLAVEAQKDPDARSSAAVQQSLGSGAGRFVDAGVLARNIGQHRGSERADPERQKRLHHALQALEQHVAAAPPPECLFVHASEHLALPGGTTLAAATVCATAAQQFDQFAERLLATVRALQVAELERHRAFDPSRHEPMLAGLRFSDLSAAELHLLPVVVAVAPATTLAGSELPALLQLIASGRPVQVLAMQDPARDPLDGAAIAAHARLELGYLGIALRDAFVQQSTAARPAHLLQGFHRAVTSGRPGLHVVDSGLLADGQEPRLGAFLHAGAAIEGRAHPLFQYDPTAGDTWAKRLDFHGNPAPDADWPSSDLGVRTTTGNEQRLQLPFTFADYALLDPSLRGAFALLPDDLASADLLPLADVLQLPAEAARRALPFVWVAAGEATGKLHRAVVRQPLVLTCRDRLRFWRTLQELAGTRNDYVREAVQRARQEAAEQAAREQQALREQHAEELERVRGEAAGVAMQGLARMLLELDPLAEAPPVASTAPGTSRAPSTVPAPATPAPAPVAPATAATPTPATPAPAAAAAADDDGYDEPWIESARCSTCNDCVNLNPLLFAYDGNKQARIKDPRAGTYAQLVLAAEKCPSRCIHPGKPLNPDEPDLEALVARAAPFNR